jgi:type VI secretion system protein ImpH
MGSTSVSKTLSPLERLQREPTRFSLDHAAAVLAPGRDPTEISFQCQPRLGAPGGEVAQVRVETLEIVAPTFGLVGPGGVLPRHYSALIDGETRRRSPALKAFVELLSRRFVGLFVKAGAKYRPTRDPVPTGRALAAAVGLGSPHLAPALATPLPAVLYHAGALANRTASAERLRGMLSDETETDVEIVEFAGGWNRLPQSEQSRLDALGRPGQYNRLGMDATIGSQVWDPSARILIRLGPLSHSEFKKLLPGSDLHRRIVELTRLKIGLEQDFAINPWLAASEVPGLQLVAGPDGAARLGWISWLTSPRPRERDASDALIRPGASREGV